MFDNLLYQSSSSLLADDILASRLPGAILLSGPVSSGKLTCALEIARILSCTNTEPLKDDGTGHGGWLCECPSCLKHKQLANMNVLLAGPRDCSLEIAAAKKAMLTAYAQNASYLPAARYLFIRAVRKLTMRFSQVLWEDDDKLPKIAPFTQAIDEQLELIDPAKDLPEDEKLEKICETISTQTEKLEAGFMYDSLPISQIRNASAWAHMKSAEGKKVFIIENIDRMLEGARNAMLKILEEPPEDTVFVLTTSRRGAVMPTILSRVRTYSFTERTFDEQKEVITRVFHDQPVDPNHANIDSYLQTFLPVTPAEVYSCAKSFYDEIASGSIPQVAPVVKKCAGFDPRVLLKLFLTGIVTAQKQTPPATAAQTEIEAETVKATRECWNNVSIYNQSPAAALEKLVRDIASIRRMHGGV